MTGAAHGRKFFAIALVAAAFLGFGAADAGAPPPSVPVEGEIYVTHSCVVYGGKIGFEGVGYAPETTVHVYVSTSRYTLPGALAQTTVRSNRAGEIKGSLPAPEGSGGKREWWQQGDLRLRARPGRQARGPVVRPRRHRHAAGLPRTR